MMNSQIHQKIDEPKTVLVVDDETDLREIIEMGLQFEGYRTLSATGGQRALEIVTKNRVDAILTDMRMSEGDGISLLKTITKRFPEIPVYIITGFVDYPTEDLFRIGAKGVLFKPFEMKELQEKLREGFLKKTVSEK